MVERLEPPPPKKKAAPFWHELLKKIEFSIVVVPTKYNAPPRDASKNPEPLELFENTHLIMVQLPPFIAIPAPKTPKLPPPTRNELLSIIQFVNVQVEMKLFTPAPTASLSVLVQSALLKENVQLLKFVAEYEL